MRKIADKKTTYNEGCIQRQSENIRLLLRAQFQALQENGLHDLMGILTQL